MNDERFQTFVLQTLHLCLCLPFASTAKEYDARGNVVSQTDPFGGKTLMDVDALSRLIKTTGPATPTVGITQQRYDTRDILIIVIDEEGGCPTRFARNQRGYLFCEQALKHTVSRRSQKVFMITAKTKWRLSCGFTSP